jgi:protein-S-isoprenylcysteine O-methyltransferase Ste14
MDGRGFTGFVIFVLGIILVFFNWIMGVVLGVVGLTIILNVNEDKIEKIKEKEGKINEK